MKVAWLLMASLSLSLHANELQNLANQADELTRGAVRNTGVDVAAIGKICLDNNLDSDPSREIAEFSTQNLQIAGEFNPNIELTYNQVKSICGAVRFKEKGQNTDGGYNFWRYEELILEYVGTDVTDDEAIEKISQFIKMKYRDLYCDKYQAYPEGGLLQQFVHSNFEDGVYEFVETYDIDIYTVTDKNGTKIIPWIDGELQGNNLTTEAKVRYKKIKDGLVTRANSSDDDDFFD